MAIKAVNPALCVIVETDIWPNFLSSLRAQNIPVFLVNARLSDRTYWKYRCLSFLMRPLLKIFTTIFAQSAEDAERYRSLGLDDRKIVTAGNLKFDQDNDRNIGEDISQLRRRLGISAERRVMIAGSTHQGEEIILAKTFCNIKARVSGALLVVAPRDAAQAQSIRHVFIRAGLRTQLTGTLQEKIDTATDVVIIDAYGLLRTLYAVADVVFIGGSMVDFGGHNPLEPASLAKPILFGPHMNSFRDISQLLLDSDGARVVKDAQQLHSQVIDLLGDSQKAARMGENAQKVYLAHRGATKRTVNAILQTLDQKRSEIQQPVVIRSKGAQAMV